MGLKKILASMCVLASAGVMAQVQLNDNTPKFMGVGKMAVTEQFAPNLLIAAIEEQNEERIANWDKERTLFFPYDKKAICLVFFDDYSIDNVYQLNPSKYASYGGYINNGAYPYFSDCNRLPLIHSLKFSQFEYSPSYVKYIPASPYNQNEINKMAFKTKQALKFIDKLEDNQWDQLFGAITNSNVDFEVRKKALNKFRELYITKGASKLPEQQALFDEAVKSIKGYPSPYTIKKEHYWAAEDPLTSLFRKSFKSLIDNSAEISMSKAYKNGTIPKLTVGYFTGKESINIDAVAKKVIESQEMSGFEKQQYIRTLQNAEILKGVMALKGLDVNKQDLLGNTLIHNAFSRDEMRYNKFSNNGVGANLTRALFVMGANPMLLNKENKSSYMIFRESSNGNPEFKAVLNAFELDPYLDQ